MQARPLAIPALALAAVLGGGVSSCLQTEGGRRSTLRQRADEILPDSARVRAFGYGDCVELASSPELAAPDPPQAGCTPC